MILHLHVLLHQESVGLRLSSQLKTKKCKDYNQKRTEDNPFHLLALRLCGDLTTLTDLFCFLVYLRNSFYFPFYDYLPFFGHQI